MGPWVHVKMFMRHARFRTNKSWPLNIVSRRSNDRVERWQQNTSKPIHHVFIFCCNHRPNLTTYVGQALLLFLSLKRTSTKALKNYQASVNANTIFPGLRWIRRGWEHPPVSDHYIWPGRETHWVTLPLAQYIYLPNRTVIHLLQRLLVNHEYEAVRGCNRGLFWPVGGLSLGKKNCYSIRRWVCFNIIILQNNLLRAEVIDYAFSSLLNGLFALSEINSSLINI